MRFVILGCALIGFTAGCSTKTSDDGDCTTACTEVFEQCDAGCEEDGDEDCSVTCQGDRDLCFTGCEEDDGDDDA